MKKIMFNEKFGLENLVLLKIKDMTRRIALDNPVENMEVKYDTKTHKCCICSGNFIIKRSQYAVGEVIAIAQSYNTIEKEINRLGLPLDLKPELYKVTGFKNKMFVKAELMPHHIKITNIRVERLQDISDEDSMREGIIRVGSNEFNFYPYISENDAYNTPRVAFSRLIDNVSGKGTWGKNPLVFVYEFELID